MQGKHLLRLTFVFVFVASICALATMTLCYAATDAQVGSGTYGTMTGPAMPNDVGVVNTIPGQPLPTVNSEDPGEIIKFILQAIKESKWAWLVGLLLMLLTWCVNKILKNKIPKKVLPWLAISLGVATSIAMSFASGMLWYEAIGNGVSLGLAAAGGWSVVGKQLLPTQAKK